MELLLFLQPKDSERTLCRCHLPDHWLVQKDDTWTRLNANSLQNYFSSAQDSSDDEVLFYTVTLNVPTDPDTVSADSIRLQTIQVEYGTRDAFYHFYGRNAAEN